LDGELTIDSLIQVIQTHQTSGDTAVVKQSDRKNESIMIKEKPRRKYSFPFCSYKDGHSEEINLLEKKKNGPKPKKEIVSTSASLI
jgi:hypothetical protein